MSVVIVCDKRRHGPIFCLIGSARLLIDKWLDVNIATLDTGEKLCCQAPTQICSRHNCEQTEDICGDMCTLCTVPPVTLMSDCGGPQATTIQMVEGGLSSLTGSRSRRWRTVPSLGRLRGREMDLGGRCDVTRWGQSMVLGVKGAYFPAR